MRYYAKVETVLGADPWILAIRADTEEAAIKRLHKKYKINNIITISENRIYDETLYLVAAKMFFMNQQLVSFGLIRERSDREREWDYAL